MLEVRVRISPPASLIEPDTVGEYLPQRALGLLQVEAAQRGLEQPLGADLRVRPVEAQGALGSNTQLVAAESLRACIPQRTEEARTDKAHEEEVVEVAGLERGVLAIVGETQELSRVGTQPRHGPVHPAQHAGDEDGGRRAPALCRQRGETRAIARSTAPGGPAAKAESEPAGQEPCVRPRTDAPVGRDREAPGAGVAVVCLEARLAAGAEIQPRLRVVFVAVGEREIGTVGRVGCQKAEELLLVPVRFGIVPRGGWRVVDVTRQERHGPVLPHQAHRVVLVPAFATEVHGVEALVRVLGQELLAIDGHSSGAGRFDRGVGVSRARDELVQLEREEAVLACTSVGSPYALGNARYQQKVSQRVAAGGDRPA